MRFKKSIKICPGVKVNFSKSGVSTTFGEKGISVNVGKKGTYLNTRISGTGLYDRTKIGDGSSGKRNSFFMPITIVLKRSCGTPNAAAL